MQFEDRMHTFMYDIYFILKRDPLINAFLVSAIPYSRVLNTVRKNSAV